MKNDKQFTDTVITGVEVHDEYTAITREDGFSFQFRDSDVIPEVGNTVRFYGEPFGVVRGLVIAGEVVFYRTEEDQKVKNNKDLYGESAEEWLRRWDAGESVWSIEMGGIGPGYEQVIQITTANILRMLVDGYTDWESINDEIITEDKFGLSGAQYGAAANLAAMLFNNTPIGVMTDARVKDRHIQVSNNFPQG